jgi:pyrrolysine biosynthesis protein PylD
VDNARATAEGYVAALELMKGSLRGEEVLVLGCGPVGRAAARVLLDRGASLALCDREEGRARSVAEELSQAVSGGIGRAGSLEFGRAISGAVCEAVPGELDEAVSGELDKAISRRLRLEPDPVDALGRYELIFDATDAGGFIEPGHLTPETCVAAPGLPLALTPDAMDLHHDRVLHDVLEIGTATMAVQAARQLAVTEGRGRVEAR